MGSDRSTSTVLSDRNMKLSRLRRQNKTVYNFILLSLSSIVLAIFLAQVSVNWIVPHMFRSQFNRTSTIASSLKVDWKSFCSQGNKVGVEAVITAEPGPHVIEFSGQEKIASQWKTKLAAMPFPQIHGRARLANVPVIMYGDVRLDKKGAVTPAELEAQLQLLQKRGVTPIRLEQLVEHLKTGIPLPAKPIVLTFDHGEPGHYQYVYPLLKKYGFPAAFAIYPASIGKSPQAQPTLTWEQLKSMAHDPLVTIVTHGLTRSTDLNKLSDPQLQQALVESQQMLASMLGVTIPYFVYPTDKPSDRLQQAVQQAGYQAAWTMPRPENPGAATGANLLTLQRIGAANLAQAIDRANGGPPLKFLDPESLPATAPNPPATVPNPTGTNSKNKDAKPNEPNPVPSIAALNFSDPVQLNRITVDQVPLIRRGGQTQYDSCQNAGASHRNYRIDECDRGGGWDVFLVGAAGFEQNDWAGIKSERRDLCTGTSGRESPASGPTVSVDQ
jgi:peptidoglycan/xylan/chitin deacetylase (PgdA/CDA1 family)